jgi:hypothetical protein
MCACPSGGIAITPGGDRCLLVARPLDLSCSKSESNPMYTGCGATISRSTASNFPEIALGLFDRYFALGDDLSQAEAHCYQAHANVAFATWMLRLI